MFRIQVLETFEIYISGQLFAWTAFLLDSLLNGPHFREKYYLLGASFRSVSFVGQAPAIITKIHEEG